MLYTFVLIHWLPIFPKFDLEWILQGPFSASIGPIFNPKKVPCSGKISRFRCVCFCFNQLRSYARADTKQKINLHGLTTDNQGVTVSYWFWYSLIIVLLPKPVSWVQRVTECISFDFVMLYCTFQNKDCHADSSSPSCGFPTWKNMQDIYEPIKKRGPKAAPPENLFNNMKKVWIRAYYP